MFIRRFKIKNWMIHRGTDVALHPITVFVGSNNGGKSALFDALINFSMVSRGRLSQAFGQGPHSYPMRRSHGASSGARIGYTVEMSESREADTALVYEITYSQIRGSADSPRYSIYEENLTDARSGKVLYDRDDDVCALKGVMSNITDDASIFAAIRRAQVAGQYVETDEFVTHCAREISRIGRYRLEPVALGSPSRLPEVLTDDSAELKPPWLGYNGEGLASVLYYLQESGSPLITQLVDNLSDVVIGLEGFDFNFVGTGRIGLSARFSDSRKTVPATNLSDGTLIVIGLLLLLLSPDRPPIICLEEPENGLTPRATQAVYETIVEVAKQADIATSSQVLLSSHSPFVIIEAWNGDERDFVYQVKPVDGRAQVRAFADVLNEHGVQLAKDQDGKRNRLNLNMANLVMDGYMS